MPQKGETSVRQPVDTVGFPHRLDQLETFLERVDTQQGDLLKAKNTAYTIGDNTSWRVALCPHDDYTYVGYLYPLVLKQVKSKMVFIIAVAHKAALFNLENNLIFDDYTFWNGVRKPITVSQFRTDLLKKIKDTFREVHKPMQQVEHSVEAMLPFIQYYNPDVQIVPILVPFMPFSRIELLSDALSEAICQIVVEHKLAWGKDFSILITTDSVHYGNEGWGSNNHAPFGADKAGYDKATAYEHHIIEECLKGEINKTKVSAFYNYTVSPNDFHQYKWTWCGRYSVPMGLLTALYLAQKLKEPVPRGVLLDYSTSIAHKPIPVSDLEGMGITAPANLKHWVGYTAMGYV